MRRPVAIVTGAGRGIGAAVATRLAADGFAVVVVDSGAAVDGTGVDHGPATNVATAIAVQGGQARAVVADVTRPETPGEALAAAEDLGRPAALVHAAGILADYSIANVSDGAWRSVMAVHLDAAFTLTRALWPRFKQARCGRIVLIGGAAGLVGAVGQANYAAAKAGLLGLMRVIALEGARAGITANLVLPFAFTRMTETIPPATPQLEAYVRQARRATPADVAPLVAWLCADHGSAISGQVLGIRGGELIVWSQPRPVARVLAPGGWTAEALSSLAQPALSGHLTSLEGEFDLFGGPPVPLTPSADGRRPDRRKMA